MRFRIGHLSQFRFCHPKRHVRVCFTRVQSQTTEQGLTCSVVTACLVVTESEIVQGQRVMWVVHDQVFELLPRTVQIAFLNCGKGPFKLRLPVDVLISWSCHESSICRSRASENPSRFRTICATLPGKDQNRR